MERIAESLEIPIEEASSYFSLVSKLSRKSGAYDLEGRLLEWVLITHTAMALVVSTLVWAAAGTYNYFLLGFSPLHGIPIFAILLSLLLSRRLFKIANREREKADQDLLIVLRENKDFILSSWKFQELEGNELKEASQK